ncbi:MAG: hypothetical protein ABL901_03630 [Hyphomicrobiaceae bacterium]
MFGWIEGASLATIPSHKREATFFRTLEAVASIHACSYGVGDLKPDNLILNKHDSVIVVDCECGKPDAPNQNFENDCKREIPELAKEMFGDTMPPSVDTILSVLKSRKSFDENSVAEVLKSSGHGDIEAARFPA